MHPLIVAEYDRMGETMGRIIWRLSPFIILITGIIAAVIVFNWAGRIGVSTYQIPADSPYWLPGKQKWGAF